LLPITWRSPMRCSNETTVASSSTRSLRFDV
jgi:hypothetical protein